MASSWLLSSALASVVSAGAVHSNTTAAEYSVLLLGDWGGSSDSTPITSQETAVIKGLKGVAEKQSSQFVVLLGDNFYEDGVKSSTRDTRFQSGFENAFSDSVFTDMPFFGLCGNHDHHLDADEQVKYHQKGSGRWNMPALNYNIDKTLPDGKTLRIVMFDSVQLVGQNYINVNDEQVEEPPQNQEQVAANWDWIETQLKEWDGDYLFTAAHYPVHSGCRHGSVLRGKAHDTYMTTYNVNGHFAGHDHCLMHISEGDQHHVLSGAGSDNWYSWSSSNVKSEAKVNWHLASDNSNSRKGGFAEMIFDSEGGKFVYYGDSGDVLYTSSKFHSRKSQQAVTV